MVPSRDMTDTENTRLDPAEQHYPSKGAPALKAKPPHSLQLLSSFKLNFKRKNGYKTVLSKSNEDISAQGAIFQGPIFINQEVLGHSPAGSPTSDTWFNTWPERCEKVKSADCSPEKGLNSNTHNGNKLTLNEALKNISLAYSPVTRKLHFVEDLSNVKNGESQNNDKDINFSDNNICGAVNGNKESGFSPKHLGHRRIQEGSFSSTISTLSEPSTSGSLIGSEDRSLSNFGDDGCEEKTRRTSFSQFFTKNVFSWKSNNTNADGGLWKLFGKAPSQCEKSPLHAVASSSALIQLKRPSTLPAKTFEEEQKHAQEYNEILAAAKKREAKSSAAKEKLKKLQLRQEEQQAAAARHFSQSVIPNWSQMEKSKKTQELWWQGLPSSVRGKVWHLAIGNELNITPQLYDICVTRAQTRLNSPEPPPEEECESNQESSMDVIELDISRTFPNLCIFQQGGPYSEVLHWLLAAYVCFRPDIGYVQGMSYIAAILILNMDACDAFICFANLLNQPLHQAAFTLNQTQMNAYYSAYNEVFNSQLPKLYEHFESSGLTPDLYLLDWIYTVFAKAMPLDVACRVWDVFLRDGYEFVFRTALGILHLYQGVLGKMDFLHGAQFLTKLPEDMSSEQLFKSIQCVSTTLGKVTFGQRVDRCATEQFR
ncbi:TBC1 domain family member 12-like [Euwallacea fornicatus]|uniref:TBC1 domain family member 12-like n=1 Tax=Euwallacea fornicatus TaxID=995702 RepID=UPI00338D4090